MQVQGDPDGDTITHNSASKLLDPLGCKQRIVDKLPEKEKYLWVGNIINNINDCGIA